MSGPNNYFLLENLSRLKEFNAFLDETLIRNSQIPATLEVIREERTKFLKDLKLEGRLKLRQRFLAYQQLKTKNLRDDIVTLGVADGEQYSYKKYEDEDNILQSNNQILYQNHLKAAYLSSLGSHLAHAFYVYAGIYSVAEATTYSIAADAAVGTGIAAADIGKEVALTVTAFTVFLPVTLVLWLVWNTVDTLVVLLDSYKDYQFGNKTLWRTNAFSGVFLLLGTLVTALLLYLGYELEMTALGLSGLAFAPFTFAVCMFCCAVISHIKYQDALAFDALLNNVEGEETQTLNDLDGATAEQAYERVKQLLLNFGIANTDGEKLEAAIKQLSLADIKQLNAVEMRLHHSARSTWLVCGGAMTVVAMVILACVGAAALFFGFPALSAIAAIAAVCVAMSIGRRLYMRYQEATAKHEVLMILHKAPDLLNKEAKLLQDALNKSVDESTNTSTVTTPKIDSMHQDNIDAAPVTFQPVERKPYFIVSWFKLMCGSADEMAERYPSEEFNTLTTSRLKS